jgi:TBC1 domain family protein 1
VLKAYSVIDEDVKYCQGMNFIVFLFLENLDRDEERAFWLLVAMMNHLKWRKLYKLDTPKLMKLLGRLKKKMIKEVEDVYMHLAQQELPVEGVFAPYFLTLFLYSTPINIAERIIDCFLYRGEEFILEMTIRMLKMKRTKILKFQSEHGCSYELQMYLSKQIVEDCCKDSTMKSILSQSQLSDKETLFSF